MAIPRFEVTVPAAEPRQIIGILQAAQSVQETTDGRIGVGVEHIGDPVITTRFTADECFTQGSEIADATKEADGTPGWAEGDGFALYQLISCGLLGYSTAEYREQAQAALEHTEHLGVDLAFAQQTLPDATPVSVGTAWDLVLAIGQLEILARDNDITGAIIHTNPMVATIGLVCEVFVLVDGKLRTKLGTPVNAGVPWSITPTAGGNASDAVSWVFLTGSVHFWKGDIVTNDAPDPIHNTNAALSEREYAYTVQGQRLAIQVDVPSRLVTVV